MEHLIRARRSTRVYADKAVERHALQKLIETARYAPTGKNTQLVNWLLINGRDKTREFAGMVIDWMDGLVRKKDPMAAAFSMKRIVDSWNRGYDGILRGAPTLVVAHATKSYPGAQTDCIIALTTFELAANAYGLGSCWAGFFYIAASLWQPIEEALDLPEGHRICGAMMAGYPKHKYHRLPLRNQPEIIWR